MNLITTVINMKKTLLSIVVLICGSFSAQTWNTTGNSGTNPTTNFIGTTDNQSLVFKINNVEKMRISPNGRLVFFNLNSSSSYYGKNLFIGGGNDNPYGESGESNSANVGVGLGAMVSNTTGSANSALGANALGANTIGGGNSAVGINAIGRATSENYNVGFGLSALWGFGGGDWNIAIGASSISAGNLNGSRNVAIGGSALRYINSGNSNIVIGTEAFRAITNGSNNISLI